MSASAEPPQNESGFSPHAYLNPNFWKSRAARVLRIASEFAEPEERFREAGVRHTVVMYGSARIPSPRSAGARLRALESGRGNRRRKPSKEELEAARADVEMSRYYGDAEELAYRLTRWSLKEHKREDRVYVCTGGGPGIMEAANRGARRAGGESVGLNIELPFEEAPNRYITPRFKFQFRYFFMRKLWFTYLSRCLVAFPGGMGTLDEIFDILTLLQTQRVKKAGPIILYGEKFWKEVISLETLVKYRTVSPADLNLIRYVDDVDTAFEHITRVLSGDLVHLTQAEAENGAAPKKKSRKG